MSEEENEGVILQDNSDNPVDPWDGDLSENHLSEQDVEEIIEDEDAETWNPVFPEEATSIPVVTHIIPTVKPSMIPEISQIMPSHTISSWTAAMAWSALNLVVITIPSHLTRVLYKILHSILTWSFTLSLNLEFTAKNVLVTILLVSLLIWLVFRYRFLTRYARLPKLENSGPATASTVWYNSFYDLFSRKPQVSNTTPVVPVDLVTDEDGDPYDNSLLSMFLSGIKVFGFLEKPVFNELSKALAVRRFNKVGEVIYDWTRSGIASAKLNQPPARDFFIVVEGGVDVWVVDEEEDEDEESCLECTKEKLKRTESASQINLTVDPDTPLEAPTPTRTPIYSPHSDHAKPRKLHLLHHVSPGSPATSLFSVLSIFADNLRLPELDTLAHPPGPTVTKTSGSRILNDSDSSDDEVYRKDADLSTFQPDEVYHFWKEVSAAFSPKEQASRPRMDGRRPMSPLFPRLRTPSVSPPPSVATSPGPEQVPLDSHLQQQMFLETALKQLETPFYGPARLVATTSHPETVLAVVPEEAFVKISKSHPKSVGGIVSVILSRFSRVTMRGFGSWLGVTPSQKNSFKQDSTPNMATMHPATPDHTAMVDVAPSSSTSGVTAWTTQEVSQLERRINTLAGQFGGAAHILKTRVPRSVWNRLGHSQGVGSGIKVQEKLQPTTPPRPPKSEVTKTGSKVALRFGERLTTEPLLHELPPTFHAPKVHGFSYLLHESFEEEDEKAVKKSAAEALGHVLGTEVDLYSFQLQTPPSSGDEANPKRDIIRPQDLELYYFEKGSVLLNEGEKSHGIHLILEGCCAANMTQSMVESDDPWAEPVGVQALNSTGPLFKIDTGAMVGYLASMTNQPSLVTITATRPIYTAFLPKKVLDKVVEKCPTVPLTFAKRLMTHLTPLVLHVDFALEWVQASAGQVLCRQNESADSVFIVLHGRLRSIREKAAEEGPPHTGGIKRGYWAAPDSPVALDDEDELTPTSGSRRGSLAFAAHRASRQKKVVVQEKSEPTGWFSLRSLRSAVRVDPTLAELAEFEKLRQERLLSNSQPHLEVVTEHGAGESVGELEVLTGLPRPTTIHAIRDTELVVMPKALFNALAVRHPEITIQFSKIIAMRAAQVNVVTKEDETASMFGSKTVKRKAPPPTISNSNFTPDPTLHSASLCNIAIIPVTEIVPVTEFADQLKQALLFEGATVSLLNTATVLQVMGKHAFSRMGKLKLMQWLAEKEESRRIVLYVADGGVSSPWTQRCVRQADCILLVGLGDEDPILGEFEQLLMGMKTTARKELVLLHNDRYVVPGSTAEWLKLRPWIHAHHHVQMRLGPNPKMDKRGGTIGRIARRLAPVLPGVGSAVGLGRRLDPKISGATSIFNGLGRASGEGMNTWTQDSALFNQTTEDVDTETARIRSDFGRIARRLLGKSIGLVLGGGGARGISHVGILKALEEADIPIDMVGGTSIGAFVGGLYSRDAEFVGVYGRAKAFSGRMSTKWRMAIDLTWPITAWFSGHEFNRGIWKCFSDNHVEDSWIPYFCTTTNITFQRLDIQRSGYLWRYVRASMSLSGFLPPLADNGSMLLDGGYCNNLPADVMRALGADTIIAVDVGARDNDAPVKYGDSLSGLYIWWDRINPFHDKRYQRIPSLAEVQSRLAYVSSVPQLLMAKSMEGCLYLRPPVVKYGTLDFEKFKEIFTCGYEYGKEIVGKWREDGTLKRMFGVDPSDGSRIGRRATAKAETSLSVDTKRRRHIRRNSV